MDASDENLLNLSSQNSSLTALEENFSVQTAGAGNGTIIAIILIIAVIVVSVGIVCWAKANQKICFKPYKCVLLNHYA